MTTSTPKTKDLNEKSRNSQFRMVSLKLSTQWTIVPGRLHSKFCAWGVKSLKIVQSAKTNAKNGTACYERVSKYHFMSGSGIHGPKSVCHGLTVFGILTRMLFSRWLCVCTLLDQRRRRRIT